jgi:ABC-2 type transport system ATP-binding protein
MADRIGVINKGELIQLEDKATLMRKLGKKQLMLTLQERLDALPDVLQTQGLELAADGESLVYTYDAQHERTGIGSLLAELGTAGIKFRDLQTKESSLEDIFVNLVRDAA